MKTTIHVEAIGQLEDGRAIEAITLANANGIRATFLNYGVTLVELEVPDKIGITDDVTLGLDDVDSYVNANSPYFGAIVGRFANRIADGKFTLNGTSYALDINEADNNNHLHGGKAGFSHQLFAADTEEDESKGGPVLVFSAVSNDGDMGYPGNLNLTVRIWLTKNNGLCYAYEATTDAPTIVNFTCHPYFNLAGQDSGSIRQHMVRIAADHYLPINKRAIPTGKLEPVNDGPFDFRELQSLDQRLDSPNPQVLQEGGFDHTFVFAKDRDPAIAVAEVVEENSGRKMEVFTTEPGIQFYTANSLDGTLPGKNDTYYQKHAGFCLETQHFPDSPNHDNFPSTVLNPGETFSSFTEYRFSLI